MNNSIKAAIYNVDDLLATIAQLRAELAAKNEDAAVGRAIRKWFAKLSGWGVSAKLELSLYRYDLLSEPRGIREDHLEPHWWIYGNSEGDRVSNDGQDMPDCPTLPDALRAAGLLPQEATDEQS